jgi:hypothetical protein
MSTANAAPERESQQEDDSTTVLVGATAPFGERLSTISGSNVSSNSQTQGPAASGHSSTTAGDDYSAAHVGGSGGSYSHAAGATISRAQLSVEPEHRQNRTKDSIRVV